MNSELKNYKPIYNDIKLTLPIHSVLCIETGRVLCFTNHLKTAFEISKARNTKLWKNVHNTHKIPSTVNLNFPQHFHYDIPSMSFVKKLLKEEESYQYILISERAAALDKLHKFLEEEYIDDELVQFLVDARKQANEQTRKRYCHLLSNAKTLTDIKRIYDEMRREVSVYGNF